jgi:hypothetical protein
MYITPVKRPAQLAKGKHFSSLPRKDGRGSRVDKVAFAWERGKVSEL